jgi:hypothetical protein
MTIYERTVTDGITAETQTVIRAPRSKKELREFKRDLHAFVEEHNASCSFDGRVADLERLCRQTPGRRTDGHDPAPRFGSRAWYAEEILRVISVVRHWLKQGEAELAASEAVEVGDLATEAKAKFSSWREILLREARTAKNRELSVRGAEARRDMAQNQLPDETIIAAARAYFAKHPTQSMRSMAATIARPLKANAKTILSRLRKRGLGKGDLAPA